MLGGAAAVGAGLLITVPLTVAAQSDDDWVTNTLDGLVSDGTLTQDQADAVGSALDSARPDGPGPWIGHGRGGPGMFGGPLQLDAAATALGIEADELLEQLRSGETIAEVAAAQGVDVQTVIDAMVASVKERLDDAIADGRLDASEEADRLADVTERITTFVNEGLPERGAWPAGDGGRPGPSGGPHRDRDEKRSTADGSTPGPPETDTPVTPDSTPSTTPEPVPTTTGG